MAYSYIRKNFLLLSLLLSIFNYPNIVFAVDQSVNGINNEQPDIISKESIEFNEKGVAIANKNPKLAEQFFQKAISLDSKNISALLNFATLKISQKKSNDILDILEEYSKLYPKVSDIHYLLGDIYFSNKDIDNAIESYKKVLILKPSTKGLYAKMGNIYLLQKKLDKAEFMYQEACVANKNDPQLLTNYANVLLANNKLNLAINIAKQAVKLKESAEAYTTLATAYEMKSDILLALENYKKARTLNKNQDGLDKKIGELTNSLESF